MVWTCQNQTHKDNRVHAKNSTVLVHTGFSFLASVFVQQQFCLFYVIIQLLGVLVTPNWLSTNECLWIPLLSSAGLSLALHL